MFGLSALRQVIQWCLAPSDELAQLRYENKLLSARAEGRMKDAYVLHMGPHFGKFEVLLRSELSVLLAEHLCALLKSSGGANFVSIAVNHDELGPLELVLQRRMGETPASKAARLERELAQLKEAA